MSKQKRKQSNVSAKVEVKKKKKRKSVPGYVQKTPDRVKTLLTCPDSALTEANIKTFVNEETLQKLPSYLQYKLITLLPRCDQNTRSDGSLVFSDEAFTNEFFTKACEEWRSKLAEGCFTDDRLQHMNIERSRQQTNDTWKIKYFENTVPQDHSLSDCSQPSLTGLSTSALVVSRKRKFDMEEEDTVNKNIVQKKLKTTKAKVVPKSGVIKKSIHTCPSDAADEVSESPISNGCSQLMIKKERIFNKKKMVVTKRLSKSSGIKKTRSLKTIKKGKKVQRDSKESSVIAECIKSNDVKDVTGVHQKCYNGQLIKSKILSHLNNKLIKGEKQSKAEANAMESSGEIQNNNHQVQQSPNEGTLTLSDLISREFELVCNGSAKETMASTFKFENFKVGFFSPKMFHLSKCSTSTSSPVLPNFWKLMASDSDSKVTSSLQVNYLKSGSPSIFSNSSNVPKESKVICSNSCATTADCSLSEYFPLLSNSLKNSSKSIEPSIAQLKTLNAKRKTQNSVEKETLLCLANKLNQKLFGKISLAPSSPSDWNSSSNVSSKTLEFSTAEWPQTSLSIKTSCVLGSETDSKCSTPKQQNIGTNFDLLKNILLSISTKSPTSNSCRSMNSISTSTSSPSPVKVSSVINCTKTFSEKSIQRSGMLALNVTSTAVNANLNNVTQSPVPHSGCLVYPPCGNPFKDLSILSSPSSKLPIPVVQTNLLEQRARCLNKSINNNVTLISSGKILELPLTINQNSNQPTTPLQLKVLPQRFPETTTTIKSPINTNSYLHHLGLASSKPHSSMTPQTRPSSSINLVSTIRPSNIDISVNDILLHNLILNEKSRIPQSVVKPTTQLLPVHGDRLVQLNLPSSSVYISGTSCNSNNNNNNVSGGDDIVKMARPSFQVPLMSALRLQSPAHQGSQVSPFQTPNNSAINVSNGSSPLIIFSPVNQQLNLASYLAVNKLSPENPLNRTVAVKKAEITPNNVYQLNLMPPQTYLPMVNMPQISPTVSKNQIILLQNSSTIPSVNSKTLSIPPDPSCNSSLKNVTFIPIVNTSTSSNQMFLLLSPNVTNQK